MKSSSLASPKALRFVMHFDSAKNRKRQSVTAKREVANAKVHNRYIKLTWVAIIKAKFHIHQRCYQPNVTLPNLT